MTAGIGSSGPILKTSRFTLEGEQGAVSAAGRANAEKAESQSVKAGKLAESVAEKKKAEAAKATKAAETTTANEAKVQTDSDKYI